MVFSSMTGSASVGLTSVATGFAGVSKLIASCSGIALLEVEKNH